jgi:hypothetical protein
MPREAAVATPIEESCVDKLAELFPNSCSIRIPVRLVTRSNGRRRLQEKTVLEFGTANEILFASALPLEFEDHIRVVSSDRSLEARATVVAVRYHRGNKAVAARFEGEVKNWIIKP